MLAFGANLITSGKATIEEIADKYCEHCGFTDGTDCTVIV